MPNHFHLVFRPHDDGDLGRWMQWLLTAHARRYHRHYGTTGHVWQGRFKAFPVQDDDHSSRCSATSSATRCGPSWWRGPRTGSGRACPAGSAATRCCGGASSRSATSGGWSESMSRCRPATCSGCGIGVAGPAVRRRGVGAGDGDPAGSGIVLASAGAGPGRSSRKSPNKRPRIVQGDLGSCHPFREVGRLTASAELASSLGAPSPCPRNCAPASNQSPSPIGDSIEGRPLGEGLTSRIPAFGRRGAGKGDASDARSSSLAVDPRGFRTCDPGRGTGTPGSPSGRAISATVIHPVGHSPR